MTETQNREVKEVCDGGSLGDEDERSDKVVTAWFAD